jgi:hypothetical protein
MNISEERKRRSRNGDRAAKLTGGEVGKAHE